MANNQWPYSQLFWRDLLADEMCRAMTPAQFGCHVRLMATSWGMDPTQGLPDDDELLAAWSQATLSEWTESYKRGCMRGWKRKDDGRWYQSRLCREWEELNHKSDAISGKRSEAARARWDKPKDSPPPTTGPAVVEAASPPLKEDSRPPRYAKAMQVHPADNPSGLQTDAITEPESEPEPEKRERGAGAPPSPVFPKVLNGRKAEEHRRIMGLIASVDAGDAGKARTA